MCITGLNGVLEGRSMVKVTAKGSGQGPDELELDWGKIERRMKAILGTTTPVLSGDMRKGYTFHQVKGGKGVQGVKIGNRAISDKGYPYPLAVEYGTKKMKPRRPVRRATGFIEGQLGIKVRAIKLG